MALTSGGERIDAIGFIPWVGLIGFDTSVPGGTAAAGLAIGLWFAVGDTHVSMGPTAVSVRAAALVLVGVGSSVAGRRLRASEQAARATAALQADLIDATLDGICFSRFFRASSAVRRAVPGTGLGLVIVRAIVEQHGGTVGLASREGEGTTVTVTLPASRVAAPVR